MELSKDITIGELVRNHPNTVKVLMGFGLGCVGCPSAQAESIAEACGVHGLEVEEMMEALNKVIDEE